ncbi:hypothetical protein HNR46_001831 [Haloferula luteola]|uniref:Pyrroloquinoline quinone-dependent pyranose dehydrogenase beta-propeller domain-containing protein n=1 Tax=Haloferula luteola TaxID=595692 RepID=A0A840V7M9_9BACT|nr:sorbosone dehydrogenase family protein [Haloferula luteola]MBB5351594.1 hypothetical protein [Haloferula luteola]
MNLSHPPAFVVSLGLSLLVSCVRGEQARDPDRAAKEELSQEPPVTVKTAVGDLTLPPPYQTASARNSTRQVAWPEGVTPTAPEGFKVTRFADALKHPRWAYVGPNGDVFVAESNTRGSADRITLLRDQDGDGVPEERMGFVEGLNQPFGMLILGGRFYVANTGELLSFPYSEGSTELKGKGEKVLDLPAGGYNNHWTRNLLASKDGKRIYITVGSGSNVGENGMDDEERRAAILEVRPDGSGERVYASGLRNPVGLDIQPVTGELWTAVNERDDLGDDLVPDYVTSVKEGGWYGWPYSYYGSLKDPRWSHLPHEEKVSSAIVPDVPLGSHTASLGLAFYTGTSFPEKFHGGAFVGQHGSWNRSKLAGYKVVFVPFDGQGRPGQPEDFLTGFIADEGASQVYGRPVGVSLLPDGSLLVCDDDAGIVWRVAAE